MIGNYFKIAWRNIWSDKVYSAINIGGLTIGLASSLLIATVVINDLSYDRQWSKTDDIYRVIAQRDATSEKVSYSPSPLGPQLKEEFPQVRSYCRMVQVPFHFVLNGNEVEINCLEADPTIWDFLDLQVLWGTPQRLVEGYPNVVISKKIKEENFPNTDPVGKIIKDISNYGSSSEYIITGVIENPPTNTHLRADALVLKKSRKGDVFSPNGAETWGQQYLLLKSDVSASSFAHTVNDWYDRRGEKKNNRLTFSFQPMKDIYLKSPGYFQKVKGNMRNVKILMGVAVMLLLIACINFINLSTARALKRTRATGLRKVLGAGRKMLIFQFLMESALFFAIGLTFGLILYLALLPGLENFIENELSINIMDNLILFLLTFAVILAVSLLTGIYPAWLLSKPNPADVISNTFRIEKGSELLRKGLVTVQFVLAVGIIIASIVVNNQLKYLNNKDLGFNKDDLLKIGFTNWGEKALAFKRAVKNIPGIQQASIGQWVPGSDGGTWSTDITDPKSNGDKIKIWYIDADIDFLQTLQLKLIKGRNLEGKFIGDSSPSLDSIEDESNTDASIRPVLLTDYTADRLGVTELNRPYEGIKGIPVGIVKDFHNQSLRNPLAPTVLRANKNPKYGNLLVRLNTTDKQGVLKKLKEAYDSFYPEKLFDYSWADLDLAKEYRAENKLRAILQVFSVLMVFLSCLGLYGLITFVVQTKTKEISIRKVLGASVSQIVALFSKNSIKSILLAAFVAIPITWYGLYKWLADFPYRIELNWPIFAESALIVIFIAFITVAIRLIKTSLQNPAHNLRNE